MRGRLLLPVALGAAALQAGCSRSPDPVTDRDGVLRIKVDEYQLRPQNLKVREGRIRVVLTNEGRLTHNLQVESIADREGEEATLYGRTDTAQPGGIVRTTTTLGPGKYRLRCTIGNHDDLGEYGQLEVLAQDPGR